CVASLADLPEKLDLLIVAVAATAVFDLVDQILATDAAHAVMLIPGGLGETAESRLPARKRVKKINLRRRQGHDVPVFLGGNCLGIVSRPGSFDSWFIPEDKLPRTGRKQYRNTALISQSGAFMLTRASL